MQKCVSQSYGNPLETLTVMMVSVTFLATTLAALVLPARGSMLVQRNISQTITGLKAVRAIDLCAQRHQIHRDANTLVAEQSVMP